MAAMIFSARSVHGSERWETQFECCGVADRELDLIE